MSSSQSVTKRSPQFAPREPRLSADRGQTGWICTAGAGALVASLLLSVVAALSIAFAPGAAAQLAGPSVDVTCEDRNGRFDFTLPNESASPVDYEFTVVDDTRTGTIQPGETEMEVVTGLADGDYSIAMMYNGVVVGALTVTVTCDVGLPHVVTTAASCLADRGRVDVTITNAADVPTTFVVDVGGVVKTVTIEADGTDDVTVTGRPNGTIPISLSAPGWTATASVTINCDPVQTATLTGFCAGGVGSLSVSLFNPAQRTIDYTIMLTGPTGALEPELRSLPSGENLSVSFSGLPDGEYLAQVTAPTIRPKTFALRGSYCASADPGIGSLVTDGCLGTRGRIDVYVRHTGADPLSTTIEVSGLAPRVRSIEAGNPRAATTVTGRLDGTYVVQVAAVGLDATTTLEVDCDGSENSTDPTVVASCLAGRGRIDVTLPTTNADIAYRVEFPGLAPRERLVPAPSTGRITITGRVDNDYTVTVFADDVEVLSTTITVSCMPG